MKQLLHLLAFGLLVPSTALAQVDAEVAAPCRDARDFYGFVRAFLPPVRRSDDTPPFDGVMGQVAAGLISGPGYRNATTVFRLSNGKKDYIGIRRLEVPNWIVCKRLQ